MQVSSNGLPYLGGAHSNASEGPISPPRHSQPLPLRPPNAAEPLPTQRTPLEASSYSARKLPPGRLYPFSLPRSHEGVPVARELGTDCSRIDRCVNCFSYLHRRARPGAWDIRPIGLVD